MRDLGDNHTVPPPHTRRHQIKPNIMTSDTVTSKGGAGHPPSPKRGARGGRPDSLCYPRGRLCSYRFVKKWPTQANCLITPLVSNARRISHHYWSRESALARLKSEAAVPTKHLVWASGQAHCTWPSCDEG